MSPAQVFAKLDAKATNLRAVVPIETREQLEELCTVIAVHADASITAVTFDCFEWTKSSVEALEPTKVMIQAMIGTATVSREARVRGLGKSPAPALKQTVRKASGVSQPATTVVLRFVADAKYLAEDAWRAINNKPAASIRAWAAAHAATHTLALKDMWSFRVVGDKDSPRAFLSALLVYKRMLPHFHRLSGRDRWFVEQPEAKTPVSWIKRNQSEAAKDFLDRVYAQAKGRGVARGESGLGVRLTDEESKQLPQQRPFRTYRIWPVPLDWTQETLEHESFSSSKSLLWLIARHPCKGGAKFLYRGRATDLELAVLEHSAGAIQIVMQRQSQRPVRPRRGAFSSTAAKSERPAPNPVQPTAAATESQSTPGRERPPAQDAPAKRQAVAAPAAPTFTLPEGLACKSNPGQGDCLFFALESRP